MSKIGAIVGIILGLALGIYFMTDFNEVRTSDGWLFAFGMLAIPVIIIGACIYWLFKSIRKK